MWQRPAAEVKATSAAAIRGAIALRRTVLRLRSLAVNGRTSNAHAPIVNGQRDRSVEEEACSASHPVGDVDRDVADGRQRAQDDGGDALAGTGGRLPAGISNDEPGHAEHQRQPRPECGDQQDERGDGERPSAVPPALSLRRARGTTRPNTSSVATAMTPQMTAISAQSWAPNAVPAED